MAKVPGQQGIVTAVSYIAKDSAFADGETLLEGMVDALERVRACNPDLADASLWDIGLVRRGSETEVRYHFLPPRTTVSGDASDSVCPDDPADCGIIERM